MKCPKFLTSTTCIVSIDLVLVNATNVLITIVVIVVVVVIDVVVVVVVVVYTVRKRSQKVLLNAANSIKLYQTAQGIMKMQHLLLLWWKIATSAKQTSPLLPEKDAFVKTLDN